MIYSTVMYTVKTPCFRGDWGHFTVLGDVLQKVETNERNVGQYWVGTVQGVLPYLQYMLRPVNIHLQKFTQ